eukprot:CAMPEP_0197188118 /NCGR_PEP_ID=MMETSP1423-20130617/17271_1 /TAXON_ID=476441 /ORGANISM="Pseudo-nitzschia heimii, Strain UNC1101" /LENGTH=213 /DNA_ID=CAMNT_0042639885 /DNA_START=151 /DNA_END=789 /DNA_ORIENTATION=+
MMLKGPRRMLELQASKRSNVASEFTLYLESRFRRDLPWPYRQTATSNAVFLAIARSPSSFSIEALSPAVDRVGRRPVAISPVPRVTPPPARRASGAPGCRFSPMFHRFAAASPERRDDEDSEEGIQDSLMNLCMVRHPSRQSSMARAAISDDNRPDWLQRVTSLWFGVIARQISDARVDDAVPSVAVETAAASRSVGSARYSHRSSSSSSSAS